MPSASRQERDLFCPQDLLPKGQKSSNLPKSLRQLPLCHQLCRTPGQSNLSIHSHPSSSGPYRVRG